MSKNLPFVYIVDDEESVFKAVTRIIKSAGYAVETFNSANSFLSLQDIKHPSCLVLDIRMPGISGLALQETLQNKGIFIPIIFITGHGDIPMTVKAMKAGAIDFLPKPFDQKTLLDLIRVALTKDKLDQKRLNEKAKIQELISVLSPRELQVMKLVIKGMLNKQIAQELKLSIKTVKIHRGHLTQKLQVKSVAELVRLGQLANLKSSV
ncbi:MAG: response regulator transcription factor [Candidatus Omnitrophica bacterium]|nr:response regulator transcription factor [Candidatus Omnitrophota bacterium]